MIIYWEMVSLLIGFFIGYFIFYFFQFRSGGVITIPLLALYTIKFPLMLPFLLFSSVVSFLLLHVLFNRYVIYGRRLLYISLIVGMFLTMIFINILDMDIGWFGLLVPGLIAYNAHREVYSTKNFWFSAIVNFSYFFIIIIISFIAIYFI